MQKGLDHLPLFVLNYSLITHLVFTHHFNLLPYRHLIIGWGFLISLRFIRNDISFFFGRGRSPQVWPISDNISAAAEIYYPI